jgi:hypothetical protein
MKNSTEFISTEEPQEYPYLAPFGPDPLIGPLPPLGHQIPRFKWGEPGMRYQALEQNLLMPHIPFGAIKFLRTEIDWRGQRCREEKWFQDDAIAVGMGVMECPYCKGSNEVFRPYRGTKTGLRVRRPQPCMCGLWQRYYLRWNNPDNVAVDYRSVTIDNLETYSRNLNGFNKTQLADLLDKVRTYEYNCFLLAGPAGTGKTTLITGMYQRALARWAHESFDRDVNVPAVWKVTASTLAKQFREWEMRDQGRNADAVSGETVPVPEVTVVKVHAAVRAQFVPCLFIEELDKIKLDSDFQAKEFSAVIDAIQSNGGQVVAASNLSNLGLKNALGEQYGPAIVRRLIGARLNSQNPEQPADESKGGFLVDFFKGTTSFNIPNPELTEWSGEKREASVFQSNKPKSGTQSKVFKSTSNPNRSAPSSFEATKDRLTTQVGGVKKTVTFTGSRTHRKNN